MVGIQFIMTGAFSMLSPIMPLLLPELGVETASAVDLWAGILNGVTSFVAAFASPVSGRVADRRGRKLMLLRSSLAIGVFTALMGVTANVWQFFAFRALMGVFAGFSSAAIALVASQVPERRLGYALGWLSTGQLVGSLVGPLIGGALADLTGSYRIPFYFTSATILLSLALVWFAVDERFVAPPKAGGRRSILSSLIAVASWLSVNLLLAQAWTGDPARVKLLPTRSKGKIQRNHGERFGTTRTVADLSTPPGATMVS